ncbi:MAG: hypothetical protein WB439_11320 [Acidobacteriaceae bacterium]
MSAKQAAFLTSRVISLWLLYQGLTTLIQVPTTFMLLNSLPLLKNAPGLSGMSARIIAESSALALRGFADLILAIFFYRFGPWVARFLLGEDANDA